MVETFQQSLRPLFFMCFVMGLTFYPKKRSKIRWIANLNILYSLIIWFAYSYTFFYMLTYFTRKILFDSVPMEISVKSNFLLSILSVIISFCRQKRFEISIKKLNVVDDTLEKLGTPKLYKNLFIKINGMIIGWIVYCFAMNILDAVGWVYYEETSCCGIYLSFVLNHCIHFNAFVDLLFIFFLWYIGTRFDKVNEYVRCLLVRQDYGLRCTWEKSIIVVPRYTLYTNYKQRLWTSMHLYLELCRLTRELNLIFTVQLTFEMASYLPCLTSSFYYLYLMARHQYQKLYTIYDWFSNIVWISTFLVRFYVINYICENVVQKANKISKLFHQLTYVHQYADIWKEIYYFTLQTIHHPLKFSGMGVFYFGHEFLRQFFMACLMYVIIMVQFKVLMDY